MGENVRRWTLVLLALAVPLLIGYDFYYQWRTPMMDFSIDVQTGRILEVQPHTFGDWTGLMAGDVILSVEGVPFTAWRNSVVGNYQIEIRRGDERLIRELPILPLARLNGPAMVSAAVVALTYWGIGTLLLLRRTRQLSVQIFYLLVQVVAVALYPPLAHPAPWPMPDWMIRVSVAGFHLVAPLLLHYVLSFPVPLGTPRQRRWFLGLIYGGALVAIVSSLSRTGLGWYISAAYTSLEVMVAIGVMVYVYAHRATPRDRRRVRLVTFSIVLAVLPAIFFYFLPSVTRTPPPMPEWLVGLSLAVVPASYLYATARYNLFDIDRLLNRALVYLLLSLGIFALFLGPLLLLYRHLPGDLLLQTMVVAGLTLLVGLTFDWARTRVQRLVDRVFYGGWYDYPGVVETVSDALARTIEREQLTDVLTRRVPEMMQLRYAQLLIGNPPHPPNAPPPNLLFTLTFQGQVRALWTIGPRRDGDDPTDADRRILQTLARQAEVALSNVLLVEMLRRRLDEIRATQRQLLRSREEERGRLARDLHDGPIQNLVGLNLQLGLLLSSTKRADELEAMRDQVRKLLSDLRQVCGELRPPMLDTLGLGAALRALAEEWSAPNATSVHLDLPPDGDLRPLPEEIAVHLYRVTQEALNNIARHAGAHQVTIRLTLDSAQLTLTIQDDGRGFTVPSTFQNLTDHGHFGLIGMQERVDLIGGTLTLMSTPGQGTMVRVDCQTESGD